MAASVSSLTRPRNAFIIAVASMFILLPTFECWKIDITLYDDLVDSRAYVVKIPKGPVSEKDRKIFQLSDENLRNAANMIFGEFPDNIYLVSPTPWNDLYKTFNWTHVERIVFVKPTILNVTRESLKIAETDSEPQSTFSARWTNTLIKSDNKSEPIDYEFDMDIEITPLVKRHPHITWSTKWGEPAIKNSGPETEVSVKSGRTKEAIKRTVNLQVDFNACVMGYVAVNFSGRNAGHHFRAIRITDVLEQKLNLTSSFHNSQIITVVYYIIPHHSYL